MSSLECPMKAQADQRFNFNQIALTLLPRGGEFYSKGVIRLQID